MTKVRKPSIYAALQEYFAIGKQKNLKKSKKVEKSFKKLLTSCSSSDNIYLADARESEQQRPDKRSEKLDN